MFKGVKKLIFTVRFAIVTAQKCKIVYIYCVFCNFDEPFSHSHIASFFQEAEISIILQKRECELLISTFGKELENDKFLVQVI